MEFNSERTAISRISETIVKGGVALYNAIKYTYSIAEEDFYNVNIKDILKVVLNNITDADCLSEMGLRINAERCSEMMTEEYNKVLPLIVYSFAVRIPTLKLVKNGEDFMTDDQLMQVYNAVIDKGAENVGNTISESYAEIKQLIKKNKPIPQYSSDWFKTYLYTACPSLNAVNNKNIFLLGFADILFAMFYSCLEEEVRNVILSEAVKK